MDINIFNSEALSASFGITVIVMSIVVFIYGNYKLIMEKEKLIRIEQIKTIVTSALYNQKIVLKKIQLLNETTNEIIAGTSKMLKEQGAEIHKQSMETNISVETLKIAFQDVLSAMDGNKYV